MPCEYQKYIANTKLEPEMNVIEGRITEILSNGLKVKSGGKEVFVPSTNPQNYHVNQPIVVADGRPLSAPLEYVPEEEEIAYIKTYFNSVDNFSWILNGASWKNSAEVSENGSYDANGIDAIISPKNKGATIYAPFSKGLIIKDTTLKEDSLVELRPSFNASFYVRFQDRFFWFSKDEWGDEEDQEGHIPSPTWNPNIRIAEYIPEYTEEYPYGYFNEVTNTTDQYIIFPVGRYHNFAILPDVGTAGIVDEENTIYNEDTGEIESLALLTVTSKTYKALWLHAFKNWGNKDFKFFLTNTVNAIYDNTLGEVIFFKYGELYDKYNIRNYTVCGKTFVDCPQIGESADLLGQYYSMHTGDSLVLMPTYFCTDAQSDYIPIENTPEFPVDFTADFKPILMFPEYDSEEEIWHLGVIHYVDTENLIKYFLPQYFHKDGLKFYIFGESEELRKELILSYPDILSNEINDETGEAKVILRAYEYDFNTEEPTLKVFDFEDAVQFPPRHDVVGVHIGKYVVSHDTLNYEMIVPEYEVTETGIVPYTDKFVSIPISSGKDGIPTLNSITSQFGVKIVKYNDNNPYNFFMYKCNQSQISLENHGNNLTGHNNAVSIATGEDSTYEYKYVRITNMETGEVTYEKYLYIKNPFQYGISIQKYKVQEDESFLINTDTQTITFDYDKYGFVDSYEPSFYIKQGDTLRWYLKETGQPVTDNETITSFSCGKYSGRYLDDDTQDYFIKEQEGVNINNSVDIPIGKSILHINFVDQIAEFDDKVIPNDICEIVRLFYFKTWSNISYFEGANYFKEFMRNNFIIMYETDPDTGEELEIIYLIHGFLGEEENSYGKTLVYNLKTGERTNLDGYYFVANGRTKSYLIPTNWRRIVNALSLSYNTSDNVENYDYTCDRYSLIPNPDFDITKLTEDENFNVYYEIKGSEITQKIGLNFKPYFLPTQYVSNNNRLSLMNEHIAHKGKCRNKLYPEICRGIGDLTSILTDGINYDIDRAEDNTIGVDTFIERNDKLLVGFNLYGEETKPIVHICPANNDNGKLSYMWYSFAYNENDVLSSYRAEHIKIPLIEQKFNDDYVVFDDFYFMSFGKISKNNYLIGYDPETIAKVPNINAIEATMSYDTTVDLDISSIDDEDIVNEQWVDTDGAGNITKLYFPMESGIIIKDVTKGSDSVEKIEWPDIGDYSFAHIQNKGRYSTSAINTPIISGEIPELFYNFTSDPIHITDRIGGEWAKITDAQTLSWLSTGLIPITRVYTFETWKGGVFAEYSTPVTLQGAIGGIGYNIVPPGAGVIDILCQNYYIEWRDHLSGTLLTTFDSSGIVVHDGYYVINYSLGQYDPDTETWIFQERREMNRSNMGYIGGSAKVHFGAFISPEFDYQWIETVISCGGVETVAFSRWFRWYQSTGRSYWTPSIDNTYESSIYEREFRVLQQYDFNEYYDSVNTEFDIISRIDLSSLPVQNTFSIQYDAYLNEQDFNNSIADSVYKYIGDAAYVIPNDESSGAKFDIQKSIVFDFYSKKFNFKNRSSCLSEPVPADLYVDKYFGRVDILANVVNTFEVENTILPGTLHFTLSGDKVVDDGDGNLDIYYVNGPPVGISHLKKYNIGSIDYDSGTVHISPERAYLWTPLTMIYATSDFTLEIIENQYVDNELIYNGNRIGSTSMKFIYSDITVDNFTILFKSQIIHTFDKTYCFYNYGENINDTPIWDLVIIDMDNGYEYRKRFENGPTYYTVDYIDHYIFFGGYSNVIIFNCQTRQFITIDNTSNFNGVEIKYKYEDKYYFIGVQGFIEVYGNIAQYYYYSGDTYSDPVIGIDNKIIVRYDIPDGVLRQG